MQEYVAALVEVMREVRRVLKPEGTVFLNIGDSYAGSKKGRMADGSVVGGPKQRTNVGTMQNVSKRADYGGITGKQASNAASLVAGNAICPPECKPKDLMLVPARLAIALQDDGWWVRSEIIWAKPNPMPESVTSRPSKAHEHIWMLTKSGRHYYNNGEGMPVSDDAVKRGERAARTLASGRTDAYGLGGKKGLPEGYVAHQRKHTDDRNDAEFNTKQRDLEQRAQTAAVGTRRLRDYEDAPLEVWRFSPVKYREAHFATFAPTLVERCLAIGCPAGGVVLDPFGGAGTTGLVADRLGYDAILAELNPIYAEMSVERIRQESPLTADVRCEPVQESLL